MVNFRYISDKFYNEFRNDDGTYTFPDNLTEYTTFLQGNAGELVKVVREIEISATVNELQNLSIKYVATGNATYGTFVAPSIDWYKEGLYDGAIVTVIIDRGKTTLTNIDIDVISGSGNSVLRLEKAQLGALEDGETYQDIIVKLESAPKWLTYKYGTIDNEATSVDFTSLIDGTEQAYYAQDIDTSPTTTTMTLLGRDAGSNLTDDLTITYDGTGATNYDFQYTLEHTFRIPFYKEGEFGNILTGTIPRRRATNLKYCSGAYFGNSDSKPISYEDLGKNGNTGYFNENFNGRRNFYSIVDFTISNASGTGKLEATEANTVTFSIQSSTAAGFVGGEEIILNVSKLPTDNESQYKLDSFDTVWLFDTIRLSDGAGAASSGRISAATMAFNVITTNLDVSFELDFSSDDQDLITSINNNLITVTLATQNLSDPFSNDRATIARGDTYTKNPDQTGIITAQQATIYPESEYDSGTGYTNFDGYNGDLLGQNTTFTVDVSDEPLITGVRFMVVADNGTNYFELYGYSFPIGAISTTTVGGNQKQVLTLVNNLDFNIPSSELINRAILVAQSPASAGSTQTWEMEIGFQIPWREWILNQNVPTSFIDYSEPNNNLNNRTSNYSGVNGFTIKTLVRVEVRSEVSDPDAQTETTFTTYYELFSDESTILDFDNAGGGGFSLAINYTDINGDPTSNLDINNDVQIDAVFTHSLGVLSDANLFGYIWILPKNGIGQPWFLSTDLDLTNQLNPLQPTDTQATGNYQYVEMVSVSNQVTLTCATNHNNLTAQDYIVYARLYPK